MIRIILGLTLAGLMNTAVANAATLIYGSVYDGPFSNATLWAFAPGGGPGDFLRFIGQIGFKRVGALDLSPGGTLYGVGFNGTSTVLITINKTTGAGTLVGPLGPFVGAVPFQDIAFRPSDGTLFGFAVGFIFTINTTTGAATIVGNVFPDFSFPTGNSLAFQGTTLYYANETALYTIDQTTGAATFVRNIIYDPAFGPFPRPPAMKFDPVSGTLWTSVVGPVGGVFTDTLGIIDPATGQTTVVAPLPVTTDGIAVTSGPLPPGSVAIPTLSDWAQMAMIAVLILVGLEALRRRRSA